MSRKSLIFAPHAMPSFSTKRILNQVKIPQTPAQAQNEF